MSEVETVTLKEFVRRIPPEREVPGYSYLSGLDVKGTILAIEDVYPVERKMRLMLFQSGDGWACVAEVPLHPDKGNVAYVRFSPLSFIALYNERHQYCRINNADCRVELLQDVKQPAIYRHDAMLPMEMRYDPKTDTFKKSIIYYNGPIPSETA
jgi:hypothetical protein